jgi:hypothetical protein
MIQSLIAEVGMAWTTCCSTRCGLAVVVVSNGIHQLHLLARPQEAEVEVVRASVEAEEELLIVYVVTAAKPFLLLEEGEEALLIFFSRLTCIRPPNPIFVV